MNTTPSLQRQRRMIDALGAAAFIALTAAALSFTLTPILNQRGVIDQRLVQLQQQHTNALQTQQTLAAKRTLVQQLSQTHDSQTLKLQSADAINRHVDQLTRLIQQRGLEVHRVQPGAPIKHDRYNVVPIAIGGQGEYPDCAALLNEITRAFPDTAVQQWELQNSLHNPSQPPTYHLQLAWHTQP